MEYSSLLDCLNEPEEVSIPQIEPQSELAAMAMSFQELANSPEWLNPDNYFQQNFDDYNNTSFSNQQTPSKSVGNECAILDGQEVPSKTTEYGIHFGLPFFFIKLI